MSSWPFCIPAVQSLTNGLDLASNIVVLVGENGSGKSTLIEAIADAYGFDHRGGHGNRKYGRPTNEPINHMAKHLQLHRRSGVPIAQKSNPGFFLRADRASGLLDFMSGHGVSGYGERPSSHLSHGESYIQVIRGRFNSPGLYLLDEAETPLSFSSRLALVEILTRLAKKPNTSVICATHCPILASLPGAQILRLDKSGIHGVSSWSELDLVRNWRRFLDRPSTFSG